MTNTIIAIDGPAASGKGTLSRSLAKALRLAHMDTGALYRAVAFEVLDSGLSIKDKKDVIHAARILQKKISDGYWEDTLGNPKLRDDSIGRAASIAAEIPEVRNILADLQKDFAHNPGRGFKGAILDGRDIGTVICPDADVKLYVTADIRLRAKRRMKELQSKKISATYDAVLDDMRERDARDRGRETAPLKPAADAVILDTTRLSESEVLAKALEIIQRKLAGPTLS